MSNSPSPLLGFNNNVRHKGRIFHIQTEDSGVKHPHVITHLFMDGGRILKTQKTSYAEHVGVQGMAETVRTLMKQQHKAMFIALRDGDYDELIARKSSGEARTVGAAVPVAEVARGPSIPPPPLAPAGIEPEPQPEAEVEAAPELDPPTQRDAPIELDLEAIERAAAAAARDGGRSSMMPLGGADLPPPPPEVLQKSRAGGGYREVAAPEARRQTQRPPSVGPRPPSQKPPRVSQAPSTGKYAVSRPASIFASNRPPEGRSIFGEDLISEKSLDEVILSYLAEDLDGPPPKK